MVSGSDQAFLQELFADLGALDIRPMFGVSGLFCNGTMFAVVTDHRVFLKTDGTNRGDFLREGAIPFVYRTRDGGEIATSYFELPPRLYDDQDEAVLWARRAYEVALRSPTSLRKQRKRLNPVMPRRPSGRCTRS